MGWDGKEGGDRSLHSLSCVGTQAAWLAPGVRAMPRSFTHALLCIDEDGLRYIEFLTHEEGHDLYVDTYFLEICRCALSAAVCSGVDIDRSRRVLNEWSVREGERS